MLSVCTCMFTANRVCLVFVLAGRSDSLDECLREVLLPEGREDVAWECFIFVTERFAAAVPVSA